MTANIRDKTLCNDYCPEAPFGESHEQGDVRYCKHGRIWYCVGNQNEYMWTSYGFWRELHPFWDRRLYRKAKEALAT